ncbi:MAG: hypothetical protein M3N50_12480 [Pseudomonadota bacterium]|nr:hypothetical protein [Pseudomonadota bacterium]
MPHFKIAHLREQGQNMIIVPLESSFEHKSDEDQRATIAELQVRARNAGLAGTVVPVWQSGGRMYSMAPRSWQSFFRNLSMRSVLLNINKELYW